MPLRLSAIDRVRAAELAGLVCCALLAALALWLLVQLVWALVPRAEPASGNVPVNIGAIEKAPTQSIADWHLFGNAPLRPGSNGAAPASTLSLILRGTVADRDPKAGVAVISDAGNGERAFRVGDEVVPGARLSGVYADRVVLLHDGVEQSLTLPRETRLNPGDVVRPTPATVRSRSAGSPATPGPAAGAANSPQAGKAPTAWQRTVAGLRQNPDELMKRVQIEPVLDGGKLGGVRVSAASDADAALMQQAGLRSGDVVTQVNGQPIDSVARGQQIMSTLGNASSVRVTVLREGKPVELTVGLK